MYTLTVWLFEFGRCDFDAGDIFLSVQRQVCLYCKRKICRNGFLKFVVFFKMVYEITKRLPNYAIICNHQWADNHATNVEKKFLSAFFLSILLKSTTSLPPSSFCNFLIDKSFASQTFQLHLRLCQIYLFFFFFMISFFTDCSPAVDVHTVSLGPCCLISD